MASPVANYNVVLLQPRGFAPSYSFLEVGRLLVHSLRSLGLDCHLSVNNLAANAVNVLLGYHLLPGLLPTLTQTDYIVYQLEQLPGHPRLPLPGHLELLRNARVVWDYSAVNLTFLRERGLDNVALVPVGYHEALRNIDERPEDIDVLFYGLINDRRAQVLQAIAASHRVESLFGLYGDSRDAYIARSKLVLNVHYYPVQIFEQVRIAYLLNNRRCVVSESSPDNPYEAGMITGALADLPELCRHYASDPEGRQRIAERGFELLRQRPMVEYLRHAL